MSEPTCILAGTLCNLEFTVSFWNCLINSAVYTKKSKQRRETTTTTTTLIFSHNFRR